jgi:hypothetical protein
MAVSALALGVVGAVVLAVRLSSQQSEESPVLVPSQRPAAAWVTDGEIHDVVQAGEKVFAAGTFTRVTSWTGGFARTDSASGDAIGRTPEIAGEVSVIVADGSGGWYVGGEFDRSDGAACPNLVHVNGSGRIDPRFCPRVDRVLAAAVAGRRLYIASDCCADVAESIIAVHPETGAALDWKVEVEGGYNDSADQDRNTLGPGIHALGSDGETLYVGGFFDELGGEERTHLAALDGRTGTVLPFNPKITSAGDAYSPTDNASDDDLPFPRAYVGALVVHDGLIYAGGTFDEVDGEQRSSVAAFDPVGGALTGWAPTDRALSGGVEALAANESGVAVAAGRFLEGQKLLYFSAASTRPQPAWAAPVGGDSDYPQVNALAFDENGNVMAVGDFSHLGRVARSHAAMLRPDGRPTAWDPQPTEAVSAVAADGPTVLLGGAFTGLAGAARDGLVAFEARSGDLLPWSPSVVEVKYEDEIDASNAPTYRLSATDERVYVFGDFSVIDRANRDRLAAFGVADGRLLGWNPDVVPSGVTSAALTADEDRVYLAFGSFVDFDFHSSATAVASDGNVVWTTPDSWDVDVNDLVLAGDELWLGGDSEPYLQALDPDTGEASDLEPRMFGAQHYKHPWIDALAASGGVVYAAGVFDTVDDSARPGVAAFEDGALTDWRPQLTGEFGVDEVDAVSASANLVYISGDSLSFTAIAGQARAGIAALTEDTAEPINWPTGGLVDHGLPEASLEAVAVVGGYRGSESPTLAIFPLRPVARSGP